MQRSASAWPDPGRLSSAGASAEGAAAGPQAGGRWRRWERHWPLLVVVALAAGLQIPAIGFGLPDLYHPDEPVNVINGVTMAADGTWNPHSFAYPSVLYDVIAFVASVQQVLTGHLPDRGGISMATMGTGHTSDPSLFLALRSISLVLSLGTCALVYTAVVWATRRRWAATGAAGAVAVSPLMVTNGVFIAPDIYATFFAAVALVGCAAIVRWGGTVDYVLAGAGCGLSVGSKYTTVPLVASVMVAHVLRRRGALSDSRPGWRRLGWAAVAAGVVFFGTNPAALFDTRAYIDGAMAEVHHYSTGQLGYQGGSFHFYLTTLFNDDALLAVAGVIALALLLRRSRLPRLRTHTAAVAAYAVIYAGMIGPQVVHFSRALLPLIPALAILTGFLLAAVADLVQPVGRWSMPALAAAVGVALAFPLIDALQVPTTLDNDARVQVRTWLTTHLPAHATVVDEAYGPWLNTTDLQVQYENFVLNEQLPANADAIVLTEQGSGRFTSQPGYPTQVAAYHHLTQQYCTAAHFTNGPWIDILTPCLSKHQEVE